MQLDARDLDDAVVVGIEIRRLEVECDERALELQIAVGHSDPRKRLAATCRSTLARGSVDFGCSASAAFCRLPRHAKAPLVPRLPAVAGGPGPVVLAAGGGSRSRVHRPARRGGGARA